MATRTNFSKRAVPVKVTADGTAVLSLRLPVAEIEAIRLASLTKGITASEFVRRGIQRELYEHLLSDFNQRGQGR